MGYIVQIVPFVFYLLNMLNTCLERSFEDNGRCSFLDHAISLFFCHLSLLS